MVNLRRFQHALAVCCGEKSPGPAAELSMQMLRGSISAFMHRVGSHPTFATHL
jgi:hypothetical protein